MVARGELWWYEPPHKRRRPYLVLTRDEVIPLLNQVLGVPATSTIRGIPTEVELGFDDGMPQPCVLTLDNVGLIIPAFCTSRITALGPDRMRQVCEALGHAVGCS